MTDIPQDVQLELQSSVLPVLDGERLRVVEGIEDVVSMPAAYRIALLAYQRGREEERKACAKICRDAGFSAKKGSASAEAYSCAEAIEARKSA